MIKVLYKNTKTDDEVIIRFDSKIDFANWVNEHSEYCYIIHIEIV